MAEPQSGTAIIPAAVQADEGYSIAIKRYGAGGVASPMVVRIPADASLVSIRTNPMLLAAVLKDGDPVWSNYELGFILVAVLHAASLDLDILQGDIYPIEGRIAVSDKAKIKYAINAHIFSNAPEITTEAGPLIKIPWKTARDAGTYEGPNYKTTVKLHVRGWDAPLVYTAELTAWFKGSNPNWRSNPIGMLELRTYAKACERVRPVGTQPEEAPPLDLRPLTGQGG
jgi:hypothetical protein